MSDLDVSKAIQAKSGQICADDLVGGPVTIKIRDISVQQVQEQPISIFYDGDGNRPWKPCKTAARCLAAIWGANAATWVGLSCTIYNDPTVTWGGAAVGGVRVSHMQGLDRPRTLQLAKTRGKKSGVTIKPLIIETVDAAPDYTPPVDITPYLKGARDAASKGAVSFRAWWTGSGADEKDAAKTIMDELKKTAADFDAKSAVDDNNEEVPM